MQALTRSCADGVMAGVSGSMGPAEQPSGSVYVCMCVSVSVPVPLPLRVSRLLPLLLSLLLLLP